MEQDTVQLPSKRFDRAAEGPMTLRTLGEASGVIARWCRFAIGKCWEPPRRLKAKD